MKFITTYRSINYNKRAPSSEINFIIIHYTATRSLKETLKILCSVKSKVSSHFLISKKGTIYFLVDNEHRAWHAGKSCWKGIRDINSLSIGIELQNSGQKIYFESYPKAQIDSLMELLQYLKKIYKIQDINILGHSDIAPERKIDPGAKFPWKILTKNNLSYVPKISKIKNNRLNKSALKGSILKKIKRIGYCFGNNEKKTEKKVIKAFQMHFQQDFIRGYPNDKTHMIVDQYFDDWID